MTAFNWYDLLYSFFTYTVIVPIILGLTCWQWLTRPERWVIAFLAALLLDELISVLCITLHTRNHFLFHIQTVTVLCSIAGVYNDSIGRKNLLWKIAFGVNLLMVVEVVFWVGFNHINSVTLAISRLLPAIYALLSLHRLFSANTTHPLRTLPMIYIHLGFFLFGAFTTVNVYFMSYFIENSLDLYFLFQNMSAMMSTIAFGFFSVCFLRVRSAHTAQMW